MTAAMQAPPLSLYVHIPWCARKCPYCDFNSHAANSFPEQAYVQALLNDLAADRQPLDNRPIQSIFFGGGTPSLMSAAAIAAILHGAEQQLGFADDIEITLEANPGSAEQKKFEGYRAAGVNRLSIGIQSFQPQHLHALGRIHSAGEAASAVDAAKRAGFDNINIDLMHGLPEQTSAQAEDDLRRAIDQQPQHLSWYQLTIEPNTAFYNQPPLLPADDALADIQAAGEQVLRAAGYDQYEVSAFATAGRQSRHNRNYWQFGDFLGIGAGAHGKITDPATGHIRRYWKTRLPEHYLQRNDTFIAGERSLSAEELPLEFVMNALRLREGFSLGLFSLRTGLPATVLEQPVAALVTRSLLQQQGDRILTTRLGSRFLNDILMAF